MADADKILSLYDLDVHAIVRRKAEVEVEFGNTLLLAEAKHEAWTRRSIG